MTASGGNRYGMDNHRQQNSGESIPNITRHDPSVINANLSGGSSKVTNFSNIVGGNLKPNSNIGPEDNELDGLNLEEKKRRRSEAHGINETGLAKENIYSDTVLSKADCT